MHHPYQLLADIESAGKSYLLAAAGADLFVVDDGSIVARWISHEATTDNEETDNRPTKKQKLDAGSAPSRIILIEAVAQYNHFLVVTEDKNINVLQLAHDGSLTELSRRCMPKRPCAVQLLAPEQLILCADKFGDVYSVPLFPDPAEDAKYAKGEVRDPGKQEKKFVPSATPLTVHTKRNLKALESQKQQKIFTERKAPLAFEHKLLLGHVSMLTDLVYVRSDTHRARILTADRDEHIRVSRPPPQAYVIEGFCFGHTEFVSVLCPLEGTTLFASAGGNDWLGIWDWTTYELKQRIDLRSAISTNDKIAVSRVKQISNDTLAVLCEKVSAIILVSLSDGTTSVETLDANPLDLIASGTSLVVSIDDRSEPSKRLRAYRLAGGSNSRLLSDEQLQSRLHVLDSHQTTSTEELQLDQALYTIANLRKRGGTEPEDAQADDED